MTVDRIATPNATRSDTCPPCSTRDNESRPNSSVPNQWSQVGSRRRYQEVLLARARRELRAHEAGEHHEHEEAERHQRQLVAARTRRRALRH